MIVSSFTVDERRLQLLLMCILVTWNTVSAGAANATLCVESSFTDKSGFIFAKSYPEPVSCQCRVSGSSMLGITFYNGSIRSDSNHERLIFQNPNKVIIFDSYNEKALLKKPNLLKEFNLEDSYSLVTFIRYLDLSNTPNGEFSLQLVSSSEMKVDCSDATNATIPPPLPTETSAGINWIPVVTTIGGVVLLALVIALAVFFARKQCAAAEQPKSIEPLNHLRSQLSRPTERNQNDYTALPESATPNRIYDEIPMNGLASTQQTADPEAKRTGATGLTEQEGPASGGGATTDQLRPSEREDPGQEHGSSSLTTDTSEEASHEVAGGAGVEDDQIGTPVDRSHLFSSVNEADKKSQTVEPDCFGNTLTDMVENATYLSVRH